MPALPLPVSSVSVAVEGAIPIEHHKVGLRESKAGCLSKVSNAACYQVSKVSREDVQLEHSVSPSLCLIPLQCRVPPSLVDASPEVALGHELRPGSGSGTGSGQPSRCKVSHRPIRLSETARHWLSERRRTLNCSPSAKPS